MTQWRKLTGTAMLALTLIAGRSGVTTAQTKPEGELRYALDVTIAPAWFDPGESVVGVLTPFWILLRHARCAGGSRCPGVRMAPSLAEVVDR